MFNTLSYLGEKLNSQGIVWAIGASLLLNHYGLIDKPNDIDILVDLNSIKKTDEILKSIGQKKEWSEAGIYSTTYFYEYIVNGIDVDVMSGLAIKHEGGVYNYILEESSICGFKEVDGISIPLTSLEDWYVIYQLIPNRDYKVKIIEDYLKLNGIQRVDLLERALTLDLPSKVKENIVKIL